MRKKTSISHLLFKTACGAVAILLMESFPAAALENGLARTPPMGWNSWNTFRGDVSEPMILSMAHAMIKSGMQTAGYRYINLDDNWMASSRDVNGDYIADPVRFPRGMKWLADSIHALGLKIGLYSSNGEETCMGGIPGGLGHEARDARRFASWGIDYLKYDNCGNGARQENYVVMRDALLACGRPIVYSICEWGQYNPWLWGDTVGNAWRVAFDIDQQGSIWAGVLYELDVSALHPTAAGPGHWNDCDMLEVGTGKLSRAQERAHFSLWCMLASPLIAGNDLRTMDSTTKAILCNTEIIGVNQDSLGKQGVKAIDNDDQQVFVKTLKNNRLAVAMLNRGSTAVTMSFTLRQIGSSANAATVRDLWAHMDLDTMIGFYSAKVGSHDVAMLLLHPFTDTMLINPPTIDPPMGYLMPSQITMACPTPGAKIYYTINGGDPSQTSTLYTAPFSITSAATVRARAFLTGKTASSITSAVFTNYAPGQLTKIRYFPRPDYPQRMVGGIFEGSAYNKGVGPYIPLDTVKSVPPIGQWTEHTVFVNQATGLRYFRYRAPDNSAGNVVEIEFYFNGAKATGAVFGTPGSYNNTGNDYTKAFDGNLATYFDFNQDNGAIAGIDLFPGVTALRPAMQTVQGSRGTFRTEFFDLSGRKIPRGYRSAKMSAQGMVLKRISKTDGTVTAVKKSVRMH